MNIPDETIKRDETDIWIGTPNQISRISIIHLQSTSFMAHVSSSEKLATALQIKKRPLNFEALNVSQYIQLSDTCLLESCASIDGVISPGLPANISTKVALFEDFSNYSLYLFQAYEERPLINWTSRVDLDIYARCTGRLIYTPMIYASSTLPTLDRSGVSIHAKYVPMLSGLLFFKY